MDSTPPGSLAHQTPLVSEGAREGRIAMHILALSTGGIVGISVFTMLVLAVPSLAVYGLARLAARAVRKSNERHARKQARHADS
jgi:hypothetical protein